MLSLFRAGLLALCALGAAQASTLIHEYDFNVDGTDSVGSANGALSGSAVVSGGVLVLDGTYGGGMDFSSHIVPTGGSYSVSLDFQFTDGPPGGIVEFISQGYSGAGFYMGTDGGSGFRMADAWASAGGLDPLDANWHTLLLSVDSVAGTSAFYLDSVLQGSVSFAISTTPGGDDTHFGRQFSGYGEQFRGLLDNVRIFDSAITPIDDVGSAAPEPTTLLLSGAGFGLLAYLRRRRA